MTISKTFDQEKNVECVDLNEIFRNGSPKDKVRAGNLLKEAHQGIYQKTFPIPSEQEDLADWMDRLRTGDTPQELQVFSVFGKNLDSKDPEIMGMIVSSYYKGTGVGLINYVIREKEFREDLKGKQLCKHHEKTLEDLCMRIDNKPLKMILWEANDPSKIEWDENSPDRFEVDCMAPQKRVDHIEKNFGCKRIGIDYAQAPLSECESYKDVEDGVCDELLLYSYNAEKYNKATVEDVEKYMITFSQALNGAKNPKDLKHPALVTMMNQLETMKKQSIPLLKYQQTDEQIDALSACNDNETSKEPIGKKASLAR